MKKILKSLLVISALAVVVTGVTVALFSDTETSTGNTFTTGTIDIAVDGENPWTRTEEYSLLDMKPSYTDYISFEVQNVGTNPVNLWKRLKPTEGDGAAFVDMYKSEPECVAEEGTWVDDGENSECLDPQAEDNDLSPYINYDMRVELYEPDGKEPVWWETIYMDEDNVKLSEIMESATGTYLGMIPVNWRMRVIQSYHMVDVADVDMNKYQGDGMYFDIELYAEQLTNEVRLVRKYEADTDLSHHNWDGDYADFSYKVKDDALRWELDTMGVGDGDYSLIVWDDSEEPGAYDWDWAERSNAYVLAHLSDSGDMTHEGEWDPVMDLENAKVWLVPGHHGVVGGSAGNFPWNPTGTYFETGLIDFYDSLD